jgi:[ribosomal protein S5]-alanine N-acetyltransferase
VIIFETPRLSVRRFTSDDLDNLHAIYGDSEVMKYIRAAITKEAAKDFLSAVIAEYDTSHLGRYAVTRKDNHQYLGNFVLKSSAVGGVEIGYAFVPAAWGKGYATELIKEGVTYAFEKAGLEKLLAVTEKKNTASVRVLIKCGFTQLPDLVENGKELHVFEIVRQ